jgi:hypothetical protein
MQKIENYLGAQAFDMLNAKPFKEWSFEKSIEEGLEKPIFHYVFLEHGLELRSDSDDKISVIFLYSDEFNGFDDSLLEVKFSWNQQIVLERFGTPSKSGSASSHPILGDYGAWDRFAFENYSVRFEYSQETNFITKITYMRKELVPK